MWYPPFLSNPSKESVLTYTNDFKAPEVRDRVLKIYCDTNRVCELEDSVVEWYDSKFFPRQNELLDVSFFSPIFKVVKYTCGGIDGLISKIHLVAQQEGILASEKIGLKLSVNPSFSSNLVHEVKRVGLLIDRFVDLNLRVGDHLVLYLSKSIA